MDVCQHGFARRRTVPPDDSPSATDLRQPTLRPWLVAPLYWRHLLASTFCPPVDGVSGVAIHLPGWQTHVREADRTAGCCGGTDLARADGLCSPRCVRRRNALNCVVCLSQG